MSATSRKPRQENQQRERKHAARDEVPDDPDDLANIRWKGDGVERCAHGLYTHEPMTERPKANHECDHPVQYGEQSIPHPLSLLAVSRIGYQATTVGSRACERSLLEEHDRIWTG